jgi:hypothetical protein
MIIVVLFVAGSVQGLVVAKDLLPSLALPLDGGRTVGGRRLFGANKTLRGALVMIISTSLSSALLFSLVPPQSVVPTMGWAGLGALIGLAYIVAELPNSFVKRQLGIEPGAEAAGVGYVVQHLVDGADSIIGVVILLAVVTAIPIDDLLLLGLIGIAAHTSFDLALHVFDIKGNITKDNHRRSRRL